MPHLVYEKNQELAQLRNHHQNHLNSNNYSNNYADNVYNRQKPKTRVTLNLTKNGLAMSKNLTPEDITLIQEKLEQAKGKMMKN